MAGDDLDGLGQGGPTLRQKRLTRLVLLGSVAAVNALGVIALGDALDFAPAHFPHPVSFVERWGLVNARLVAAPILWIVIAALAVGFPQVGGRLAMFALTVVGLLSALRTFVMIGLSGI